MPEGVEETHVSLFDGSNCGIALAGRPVFSVQHHPEASPGPQDSHYLFRRFVNLIRARRGEPPLDERPSGRDAAPGRRRSRPRSRADRLPQIGLLNVSQSCRRPLLKPRANQVWRCSEVPWLKLSGTT